MATGKVTKAMLVQEARRVFGDACRVTVDQFDGLYWFCHLQLLSGARFTTKDGSKQRSRRALYETLNALEPRIRGHAIKCAVIDEAGTLTREGPPNAFDGVLEACGYTVKGGEDE